MRAAALVVFPAMLLLAYSAAAQSFDTKQLGRVSQMYVLMSGIFDGDAAYCAPDADALLNDIKATFRSTGVPVAASLPGWQNVFQAALAVSSTQAEFLTILERRPHIFMVDFVGLREGGLCAISYQLKVVRMEWMEWAGTPDPKSRGFAMVQAYVEGGGVIGPRNKVLRDIYRTTLLAAQRAGTEVMKSREGE